MPEGQCILQPDCNNHIPCFCHLRITTWPLAFWNPIFLIEAKGLVSCCYQPHFKRTTTMAVSRKTSFNETITCSSHFPKKRAIPRERLPPKNPTSWCSCSFAVSFGAAVSLVARSGEALGSLPWCWGTRPKGST